MGLSWQRRRRRVRYTWLIGTWREAKAERHDEGQAVFFRGWVFRDPETEASVGYDDAGVVAAGILVLRAAGVSHRREVLQHEAFRPGEPLALTPEPSNLPATRSAGWPSPH